MPHKTIIRLSGVARNPANGFPARLLGNRYGAQRMMMAGGVLYGASMILLGFIQEFWQFFLVYGVMLSMTQAISMVPLMASISGWFRTRLGLGTGILWAAGGLGREPGGSEAMANLVNVLGVPVIEIGTAFNLPNSHPMNVTGANADVLKDADLVVAVGVKDVESVLTRAVTEQGNPQAGLPRTASGYGRQYESLVSEGTKLIRIGLNDYGVKAWPSSYGRLLPTDVNILGNGALVLAELAKKCREAKDAGLEKRAADRAAKARPIHDGVYQRAHQDLKERWWDQTPTSTARLAAEIWEAIKEEDWVLVHGSLSGWERRLWNVDDPSRWVAGGGGTGTGMGVAMGAALAFRGTGKVCVSIQNDGDLLYTGGSMWTAAHHQIPMLVVMFNNQSYYQDVGHQSAVARMRERSLETVGVGVSLEGPNTDFATLAKSFSLYGDGPILDAGDIGSALKRGLDVVKNEGRLALIDTVVQPR